MADLNMAVNEERDLWSHTEELIQRLRISFFAWLIATFLIGFFPTNLLRNPLSLNLNTTGYIPLVQLMINTMQRDLLPPGIELIAGTWFDPFWIYFLASSLLGLIFSSPVIAYEIYAFINPALYPHERKYLSYFVISFVGLFALGAIIAYKFIVPITFKVLLFFVYGSGASPLFNMGDFYSFIILAIVIVGLVFTFPVVVSLLVSLGIITQETLKKNRKTVLAAIFIATAVFTPDPTPLSMLVLAIPLTVLFEGTVLIAGRIEKGQRKEP